MAVWKLKRTFGSVPTGPPDSARILAIVRFGLAGGGINEECYSIAIGGKLCRKAYILRTAGSAVMPEVRRLGFVDVGARDGTSSSIEAFHDRLVRTLIEPEQVEARRLREACHGDPSVVVVDRALGHVDGQIRFYETMTATCSSVLKVNESFIEQYAVRHHFAHKSSGVVECSRFDTLFNAGGLPTPDIIKIDVQGFEYQVLLGFGALLQNCLAIELETHFYKLYEDQRTIGDLVSFLESFGFTLRRLSNNRSPDLNGDPTFEGDLVEVDATFTKGKRWFATASNQVREDFALACSVVGVPSYV